jgi:hypothetical protein
MRSNGSRSGPSSVPARWPCSTVTASGWKFSLEMTLGMSGAIAAAPGSLPIRTLVSSSSRKG